MEDNTVRKLKTRIDALELMQVNSNYENWMQLQQTVETLKVQLKNHLIWLNNNSKPRKLVNDNYSK